MIGLMQVGPHTITQRGADGPDAVFHRKSWREVLHHAHDGAQSGRERDTTHQHQGPTDGNGKPNAFLQRTLLSQARLPGQQQPDDSVGSACCQLVQHRQGRWRSRMHQSRGSNRHRQCDYPGRRSLAFQKIGIRAL